MPDELGNRSIGEATQDNLNYVKNQANQLYNTAVDGWSTFAANNNQLIKDYFSTDVLGDASAVANAVGDAAVRYLQEKLKNIKEYLSTTSVVEVRTLVGEISPYVKDPKQAAEHLGKRIDSLVSNYTSSEFWRGLLGDFESYLAGDANLRATLSGLTVIRGFAQFLNTCSDLINTYKKLFKLIEPIIPIIEISSDLFQAIVSKDAFAAKHAEEGIKEAIHKETQQLTTLLLGSFRKYIYSLKVRIPNLLLGAVNSLSVRDAMNYEAGEWSNGWLDAVFDEDFYDKTVYSYTWEESWNKTIRDTLGSHESMIEKWSRLEFKDSYGRTITRGEFIKNQFMSEFTQNFMTLAIATARKDARIRTYNNNSWVKFTDEDDKVTSSEKDESSVKISFKNRLMKNNLEGLTPFNSTGSIITISAQILERYN